MPLRLANNAVSSLASAISSGDTSLTIQLAEAGRFPTLAANDYFPITVADAAGNVEIMKCTARAGAILTVSRAQEGTSAKAFDPGAVVELRSTAATLLAIAEGSIGEASTKTTLSSGDAFAFLDSEDGEKLKRIQWQYFKALLDLAFAAKESAEMEGTPSAPTPDVGDNSNRLATTAFVKLAIAQLIDSAPGALDTLNELADALGNDPDFATTMTNALAGKLAISAKATKTDAEAGSDDTKYMTPLQTKNAIAKLSGGGVTIDIPAPTAGDTVINDLTGDSEFSTGSTSYPSKRGGSFNKSERQINLFVLKGGKVRISFEHRADYISIYVGSKARVLVNGAVEMEWSSGLNETWHLREIDVDVPQGGFLTIEHLCDKMPEDSGSSKIRNLKIKSGVITPALI